MMAATMVMGKGMDTGTATAMEMKMMIESGLPG